MSASILVQDGPVGRSPVTQADDGQAAAGVAASSPPSGTLLDRAYREYCQLYLAGTAPGVSTFCAAIRLSRVRWR